VYRLFLGLIAASTATLPLAARAQAPRITSGEIDSDLRYLSSDLLEGRAPATRGGQLASGYIASALQTAGVAPGNSGSYLQSVPIDVVDAEQGAIQVRATGKATASLRDPDDVVVWSGSAVPSTAVSGELVFVGYGVQAPEYKWDDFKGMDLKGKVLLILVNDPPATAAEPTLFDGPAMTYYGRWTYKFEEAERLGAVGALIIHTEERAGYPWHTVVGSWAKAQRMLPRDPKLPAPLGFRGWITDSAATALLSNAGLTLSTLRDAAGSRDFKPVATGITVSTSITNHVARMTADNVIGIVPGRDPALRAQYVVFSAHWDHLGIGPAVNGDSIYNGAEDNASGVADVLAMARAAVALPATQRPRRSLVFLFVTAEESGLLGSEYFAEHPTVPAGSVIADINVDGGNLLGRVRDLTVLGEHKSTLGPSLARFVAAQGLRLAPDAHPEQGHFYRSDHFSFARAGVPAVSIGAGTDFVGHPKEWGVQQQDDYTAHRYHQPSDEYRPDFDLKGAVQLSEIVLGFGIAVANAPTVPDWAPGAEFHRATSTAAVQ
jgi:Zn-dependent M28 family amino/carboxypeptidase